MRLFLAGLACAGLLLALSTTPAFAANQSDDTPAETRTIPPAVTPPTQPQTTATATVNTAGSSVTLTVTTSPALSLQDAIEGILDEDDLTRQKAQARLAAATEADLPTLEKFADSTDPEIHRQVHLLLKKLKRGTFAFVACYPDQTPAAQAKFNVKLSVGEGAAAEDSHLLELNSRKPTGITRELLSLECTADADGKVVVGRFNDGDYIYTIEPQDPLPPQPQVGKISLQSDSQPLRFEVKHGVTVTVTVTGPDGLPLPDVTVFNAEDANFLTQARQTNPSQIRMSLGRAPSATTDQKGVAVLEKVGLREINIVAFKDTFDCAFQENVKAADGGVAQVALSLVKTTPYKCTLTLRAPKGKLPAGIRLLAMRQNDVNKVIGPQWTLNLDLKKIDDYIKAGGIDLGEAPADGEIKTELLPEFYFVVGLTADGGRIYYSHFNVVLKGGTIQALFRELPRPAR